MSTGRRLSTFRLRVELPCECKGGGWANHSVGICKTVFLEGHSGPDVGNRRAFLASASSIRLSQDCEQNSAECPVSLVAIFLPLSVLEPFSIRRTSFKQASGAKGGAVCEAKSGAERDGSEGSENLVQGPEARSRRNENDGGMQVEENALDDSSPQLSCQCVMQLKELGGKGEKSFDEILLRIHPKCSGLCIRGIILACSNTGSKSSLGGSMVDLLLLEAPRFDRGSSSGECPSLSSLVAEINGEPMVAAPYAVIKCLPLSNVSFLSSNSFRELHCISAAVGSLCNRFENRESSRQSFPNRSHASSWEVPEIPSCPVCLHRIDPERLGLPKLKANQLCCNFCTVTSVPAEDSSLQSVGHGRVDPSTLCKKQKLLSPWPEPSWCDACQVIQKHCDSPPTSALTGSLDAELPVDAGRDASNTTHSTVSSLDASLTSSADVELESNTAQSKPGKLFCYKCRMKQTLWVCLTCGIVGCGRYSHGHAEEHYKESGHPYSLELVSMRIWDYNTGEFAHRGDLLKCPSMHRIDPRTGSSGSANSLLAQRSEGTSLDIGHAATLSKDDENLQHGHSTDCHNLSHSYLPSMPYSNFNSIQLDETSPKKATMIGEEYEALLQSALEDQAQHYEGEISRLHATLTAEQVDEGKMSEKETMEVEELQGKIASLRDEADRLGRQLLEAQAQEAGYRATSQRLLREQAVAKGILEKIREDSAQEHEMGKLQVEDLEQQITDLSANLKMRHQISQDRELNNAQIFGTTSVVTKQPKRGKKVRRSPRK